MKAGPVTKIRYRRVCEKPVDLLLNLGTRSKVTIYRYAAEPHRRPGREEPDRYYGCPGLARGHEPLETLSPKLLGDTT